MPLRRNRIPQTRGAIAAAAARGVHRAAGYVLDLARQLAPKDTGALAASGRLEPDAPAARVEVRFGDGLPDARAVYQEYGTSRMAAQPYLTPAARAINVRREVAAEIQKALR